MTQKNGCLRSKELDMDITWVEEARAAALSDVLRVHEWPYVKQIQSTLWCDVMWCDVMWCGVV